MKESEIYGQWKCSTCGYTKSLTNPITGCPFCDKEEPMSYTDQLKNMSNKDLMNQLESVGVVCSQEGYGEPTKKIWRERGILIRAELLSRMEP